MPIAVPPIDWQRWPAALQLRLQCRNQLSRLLVNGALALEVVVVLGHGQHALARNIATAQHVLKKRNHLFTRLRSAERNDQNRIVVHIHIICYLSTNVPAENTCVATCTAALYCLTAPSSTLSIMWRRVPPTVSCKGSMEGVPSRNSTTRSELQRASSRRWTAS